MLANRPPLSLFQLQTLGGVYSDGSVITLAPGGWWVFQCSGEHRKTERGLQGQRRHAGRGWLKPPSDAARCVFFRQNMSRRVANSFEWLMLVRYPASQSRNNI